MKIKTQASSKTQKLIDGLNEDLRGEFQAVIMYRLYASMVQGPYRQELRAFFANEIPEELTHAQLLADKISALGGVPAATAAPVTVVSDAKGMLEAGGRGSGIGDRGSGLLVSERAHRLDPGRSEGRDEAGCERHQR